MRRGLITVAALAVLVAVPTGVAIVGNVTGDHDPTLSTPARLETRTVEAGEVDVEIEPRQLDDQGAVFAVTFDTHSVELSADLTGTATLEVDGVTWPVNAWSGDGPGGHHRAGALRFDAAGPARGAARLMIDGLPESVEVTWDLGG